MIEELGNLAIEKLKAAMVKLFNYTITKFPNSSIYLTTPSSGELAVAYNFRGMRPER